MWRAPGGLAENLGNGLEGGEEGQEVRDHEDECDPRHKEVKKDEFHGSRRRADMYVPCTGAGGWPARAGAERRGAHTEYSYVVRLRKNMNWPRLKIRITPNSRTDIAAAAPILKSVNVSWWICRLRTSVEFPGPP